jgi:CHAT domain-containing protein
MNKSNLIICAFITTFYFLQMNAQTIDSLEIHHQNIEWKNDILIIEKKISDSKVNSQNVQEYTMLIKQLAYLYIKTGNLKKAEENLLINFKIIESTYQNDVDNYINEIEEITQFFISINDLSNADFYAQKGYEVTSNNHNDKKYLNFLSVKASIKSDLGDYETAYVLYLECISLSKDIYGSSSYFYGLIMGNMGDLMIRRNDYENAKRCYLIYYLNIIDIYGDDHIETAIAQNKLSNIYVKLNNFQKALELNLSAHKIISNLSGETSSDYATSCYNLACTYALLNDFEKSEKYYLQAYKINTTIYGSENTNSLSSLKSLIILHDKMNTLNLNKDFLSNYFILIKHKIKEIETNFSQKELIRFSESVAQKNYTPSSFLQKYSSQYPEINIGCFENQLLLKSLSLHNQERIKSSIENSVDAIVKEKYQQFIDNKRYLTKLDEIPISQRPENYEVIKTETESLEKEVTRLSSTFADAKKSLTVNWKQVQEKLKPNEIAIDLVDYTYYNKKWTDSIYYGAFIIKKNSKYPEYISLFEKKQLSFLLSENINQIDSTKINKRYSDKAISDLFLKPLQNELKGVSGIYLSPSGLGHQINFSALPVSETQTLGDKYEVHILGSTAEIMTYTISGLDKKNNFELILYGGIDYNSSNPKAETDKKIVEHPNDVAALRAQSGISGFDYLNGTNNEVEQIQLKGVKNGYAVSVYKEREATEESIKVLDGRTTHYVLHLATHGFFFPDPKQEISKDIFLEQGKSKFYKASDDPMMRSGLLLAGANNYWGKSTGNTTTEDGILTANEISNLDLSGCQLVVLSACETGLGQINGSEGVFGFQRAFKMAGVKNIIMSLWKVPDAQTSELFDIFYSECFKGKTIHEAFQTAQAKMKVKYAPYYWAGFVLLE